LLFHGLFQGVKGHWGNVYKKPGLCGASCRPWADFSFSVRPKRQQSQGAEAIIIDFQPVMICLHLAHLHSGLSKKLPAKPDTAFWPGAKKKSGTNKLLDTGLPNR
jgi:hypothetical protein